MEELFQTCGYIASFIGTFIEGEIFLTTSVVAAKMGYMKLYGALAAAWAGAYARGLGHLLGGAQTRTGAY